MSQKQTNDNTVKINIYMSKKLFQKLVVIANQDQKTLSFVIRKLLNQALKENKGINEFKLK